MGLLPLIFSLTFMTFPCRDSLSFTGRLVFCFVLTNKNYLPNNSMPRLSLRNSMIYDKLGVRLNRLKSKLTNISDLSLFGVF